MKFINDLYKNEELTYEDVFLLQQYFSWNSRFNGISVAPEYSLWSSLPIVSANMNAVTWKRMAETLARLWWIWILPQDMDIDTLVDLISRIKNASSKLDTPITVKKSHTIRDAMWIIYKRAHHTLVLVDDENKPLSIFTPKDFNDQDQYSQLWNIKKSFLITWNEDISDEAAFDLMDMHWISSLPIINEAWILVWIMTKKSTVRNSIYSPSLDAKWKLKVWVALWINNFLEKAKIMIDMWIELFVLDTAHWYQKKMIDAIKLFRSEFWDKYELVAWNVITAEWTKALLEAWANWVKVWVWPWAMCTTRMKTWVWRPQFTAVYKCSEEAKKHWWFVWADGWVKEPRDLVLWLAAWANHIMIGTTFAGTFESTWDIKYDMDWRMYKENYWMASRKAVHLRNNWISAFEQAKKALFKEWISTSKIYIKEWREWAWDIVDEFITWLRSAMTYVGASNLTEFNEKAIIWVQTSAWFTEGTPHWKVR